MNNQSFDPHKPREMFDANVPHEFQADAVRAVVRGYEEAEDKCRAEFDDAEYHDMIGHYRRALIERNLRLAAKKHGFSGRPQQNSRRTSNFSQIICNRVVLTCSAAQSPNDVVRYAEFRCGFARSSQLGFFGNPEPPPLPKAPLYALIIHVPAEQVKGCRPRPASIRVVFPTLVMGAERNIAYVGEPINLVTRFANIMEEVAEKKPRKAAEEIQKARPRLRKSKEAGA